MEVGEVVHQEQIELGTNTITDTLNLVLLIYELYLYTRLYGEIVLEQNNRKTSWSRC